MSFTKKAILLALSLFIMWMLATYLLEGMLKTFRQPDATMARFTYALIANLLIGVVASTWLLSTFLRNGALTSRQSGFQSAHHAVIWIVIGIVVGLIFYLTKSPVTFNPLIIVNAYAQVLVVSAAEILVCWAVIGGVLQFALRDKGKVIAIVIPMLISSILFGLYHFAHSPPFNTFEMVAKLAGIGLITSAFFIISRDVYGTIVFHSFLGTFGVTQALATTNKLGSFNQPMFPLYLMAIFTIALLIIGHKMWLAGGKTEK